MGQASRGKWLRRIARGDDMTKYKPHEVALVKREGVPPTIITCPRRCLGGHRPIENNQDS